MTNEELIAKIREEIERRMDKHWEGLPNADAPEDDWTHNELCELGAYKELEHLETFLSTLEEQAKGYDESYIQSKIAEASETWKGVGVDEYLSQVRGKVHNPIFDKCLANVAPGVREEVRRNIELDEELERFIASGKSVTVDDYGTYSVSYHDFKKVARHFAEWQKEQDDRLADIIYQQGIEKGKDDMKEQMLAEAEECELYWDGDFLAIDLNMAALGYSERDKVRIVICKKEGEE